MIDKSDCINIGTLIKSHGINGEAAIMLKDGFFSDQVDSQFLFIDIDDGLVPFEVENIRDKSDNIILVRFDLCKSEKMIQPLVGSSVWIDKNDILIEEGETVIGLLVGFKVIDEKHGDVGIITEMRDIEKNPLFVIEGTNGEILIPIADEFIRHIDEENKVIRLSTPEGLLDLYL
ncbi:MAG: 16S rRNA processing protein RimM [Marinilabiliaceae bacterium]|nr:16S rRNA processing protein RimM [Marinilabiliaceae bacterium]